MRSVLCLCLSITPALALAAPFETGQRHFGFGPVVGTSSGVGLAVHGGSRTVGVEAVVGYNPLLSIMPALTPPVRVVHTLQANGSLYVTPAHIAGRAHVGGKASYHYNLVLGHGGALAAYGVIDIHRRLAGRVSFGVGVYPGAERAMEQTLGVGDIRWGVFTPIVHVGATVGLLVFPGRKHRQPAH